ncbi:hypothetical protein [Streptomyces sp. NPDC029704]|uniref:hypothetical protein n=1 Tax=Streptomyces sp. NPDC029704 TaxID=3156920 RepID=UPI0033DF7072
MKEVTYGLSSFGTARPRKAERRRHVVWGELAGKCGAPLIELTQDMSLRLCDKCRASMVRLQRERREHCPRWQ